MATGRRPSLSTLRTTRSGISHYCHGPVIARSGLQPAINLELKFHGIRFPGTRIMPGFLSPTFWLSESNLNEKGPLRTENPLDSAFWGDNEWLHSVLYPWISSSASGKVALQNS